MNNFKIIYKILKTLDKNKGNESFDIKEISADALKVGFEEWEQLMIELQRNDYIDGVIYDQTMTDLYPHIEDMSHPRITLSGMEYLADNSMMHKAAKALKAAGEFFA